MKTTGPRYADFHDTHDGQTQSAWQDVVALRQRVQVMRLVWMVRSAAIVPGTLAKGTFQPPKPINRF